MAKRNSKIDKRANKRPRPTVADKKTMARRDRPLPSTLPVDLIPYDTNNDGVLSEQERLAMKKAKLKEKLQEEMKKMKKAGGVRARKKTN